MKKIKSVLFSLILLFICNTQTMSPEVQQQIIEMEKWIYTLYPEELAQLIGQSFSAPQTITAEELKKRIEAEKDLIVINVLSERVYDDCHIKGSINVPLHEMVQTVANWDRSKKIIVYCALEECDASEKGYILLSALGFKDVIEYPGGILEWFKLGYPINGPCALSYLHEEKKALLLCHPTKKSLKK